MTGQWHYDTDYIIQDCRAAHGEQICNWGERHSADAHRVISRSAKCTEFFQKTHEKKRPDLRLSLVISRSTSTLLNIIMVVVPTYLLKPRERAVCTFKKSTSIFNVQQSNGSGEGIPSPQLPSPRRHPPTGSWP